MAEHLPSLTPAEAEVAAAEGSALVRDFRGAVVKTVSGVVVVAAAGVMEVSCILRGIHGTLHHGSRQIVDRIDCTAKTLSIDTASFRIKRLSYRQCSECLTDIHMQEHSSIHEMQC